MGKTKALLPLAALLLAACGQLSLPGLQPKPFKLTLDLPSPLQTVAPGGQVQVPVQAKFNDPRVASVTLTVRLADPCAKGTSYCPGWDASRYPGVVHPTRSYPLTPASPSASLLFQVDPGAPPQGPFKYELVLSGQDASGNPQEEAVPFYLKVLRPGEISAMEYWNLWRDYMGYAPVQEDPEWSFRAWLHGRYLAMNIDKDPFAHDEDLSYPFSSPEGKAAGARGNVGRRTVYIPRSSFPDFSSWPLESAMTNGFYAVPFHRLSLIAPDVTTGGFGLFRAALDDPAYPSYWRLYSVSTQPVFRSGTRPTEDAQLFPVRDKTVPLNRMYGERPPYNSPCQNPDKPASPPYLTHQGLDWSRSPFGLALSVRLFAAQPTPTKVLEARLTRVSDNQEVPVCAYGSEQYWAPSDQGGDLGNRLLAYDSAVFVVPRYPLDPGETYRAEVRAVFGTTEERFNWSFRVAPQDALFPYF
uniref:CAP domain-containing protein n=1 Tax=Thermus islandicus TaxID=540988 RepID=A0A7C2GCW7_9DEIN